MMWPWPWLCTPFVRKRLKLVMMKLSCDKRIITVHLISEPSISIVTQAMLTTDDHLCSRKTSEAHERLMQRQA